MACLIQSQMQLVHPDAVWKGLERATTIMAIKIGCYQAKEKFYSKNKEEY